MSRCLGLAEALAEHGIGSRFFGRFEAGAEDLLFRAGISFERVTCDIGTPEDLQSTIDTVRRMRAEGVVLDSYRVDDYYVSALDRKGAPLLLIDDFARLTSYDCSAVLNFTVNATQLEYPRRTQIWLLGPRYVLLRRRFRLLRAPTPRSGDVHRVLVAMGGVDTLDLSRLVVQALLAVAPHLSVRVIVGQSYRFVDELSVLLAGFRGSSAVLKQIDDLAEELARADICVSGGGLTKYESAYMGVPSAVISHTREQAGETVHFAGKGLTMDLGLGTELNADLVGRRLSTLVLDAQLRASLSRAGLACIPRDSTARAAEAFAVMLRARA